MLLLFFSYSVMSDSLQPMDCSTPGLPVPHNLPEFAQIHVHWIGANLPWFTDLTFQVPRQYCTLQRQILLSSPDTSTTEHYFCFGPAASFLLELLAIVLCSSPVAYWTPSDLRDSSFGVISFCLFIQFMGFSWKEYCFAIPSSKDHILSEGSTMTHLYWVTLQGMAHCFIELLKPLHKSVTHRKD